MLMKVQVSEIHTRWLAFPRPIRPGSGVHLNTSTATLRAGLPCTLRANRTPSSSHELCPRQIRQSLKVSLDAYAMRLVDLSMSNILLDNSHQVHQGELTSYGLLEYDWAESEKWAMPWARLLPAPCRMTEQFIATFDLASESETALIVQGNIKKWDGADSLRRNCMKL